MLTQTKQQAAREPSHPPLVETAIAKSAESLTITQTAFLRPSGEVSVTAQTSGRIRSVSEDFHVGTTTKKNTLLVALEMEDLQAGVEQAEARVEQAKAALAEARVTRRKAGGTRGKGLFQ
ncbi:hypothetical protein [Rhizobium sp. L1K21]|uniref:hypothetical protein n=1 Tax=Rhizobium sp. L1K21 TaxID=2954933 RepID=UPI002092BF65|nr:hypothetical protein [Rhizobium sp. L1K21]MCO6188658.1 hypothetical protein [Rhizobium sp. L1K21]